MRRTALEVTAGLVALGLIVAGCGTPGRSVAVVRAVPKADTKTCDVQAAGLPHAADVPGRSAAIGSSFAPAEAAAPAGTSAMSAAQAVQHAGRLGGLDDKASSVAPTTVEEVSYQAAQTALGGLLDPRIAPNRCVWMVTVQAAYHGPGGSPPGADTSAVTPAKSFAVLFDVNSGFWIAISPIY